MTAPDNVNAPDFKRARTAFLVTAPVINSVPAFVLAPESNRLIAPAKVNAPVTVRLTIPVFPEVLPDRLRVPDFVLAVS